VEDTTIENVLKTFEDFYLKKDYPSALKVLEKSEKEIDPALWHYNMGTTLGELNNWPMARFHFILADKAGFTSKELEQNIKVVEKKLDVARLEKPLTTSDFLIKSGLVAAEGPLISLSLIIIILSIWKMKKNLNVKTVLASIMIMTIPLLLSAWINSWEQKMCPVSTPIYEGPSALFHIKGELPAGIVVLTNKKDDWEKIIFPSRYSGWIKTGELKLLETK
jgi:hypothetical protein